jgi:hypothetical protein
MRRANGKAASLVVLQPVIVLLQALKTQILVHFFCFFFDVEHQMCVALAHSLTHVRIVLVIEAIVENLKVKWQLFSEIEKNAPPSAVTNDRI